jgi:hypothetical protein
MLAFPVMIDTSPPQGLHTFVIAGWSWKLRK